MLHIRNLLYFAIYLYSLLYLDVHRTKEHNIIYSSGPKQVFVTGNCNTLEFFLPFKFYHNFAFKFLYLKFLSGASPSVDEVFAKMIPHFDEYKDAPYAKKIFSRHKSKSLDFLTHRG